ncbi:MAG: hypothetical protein Q7U57_03520 [Methylovulum sp.]|nr:hypothetical protein [Methylovulum sp.]
MNLNRRKFLTCTCLTSVALLVGKHVCAGSKTLPSYCSLQGGISENGFNLLRTSGNPDLDRAINSELFHLGDTFNVSPGFGFFEEIDSRHANAFATTKTFIPDTNQQFSL